MEDWIFHCVLPLFAYVLLCRFRRHAHAQTTCPRSFGIATFALLLLFIGIRNAWDTVTYVAVGMSQQQPPAEKPPPPPSWLVEHRIVQQNLSRCERPPSCRNRSVAAIAVTRTITASTAAIVTNAWAKASRAVPNNEPLPAQGFAPLSPAVAPPKLPRATSAKIERHAVGHRIGHPRAVDRRSDASQDRDAERSTELRARL